MASAIVVSDLSKQYRIGTIRHYKTLRESLVNMVKTPFRGRNKQETIWALKDVSFEVEEGEVVGIIGRNGSGKSTLLKLLSRITYPTTGDIKSQGKIAPLLEVGTGFHPELTGRENIYLNGSIMGMKKKEINAKFDDIVTFAELEKFIDTPVKRYSSGMYLRLGFAVAAHLDPDILLVDEVLAVGDAAFQKKCIGAMKNLQGSGRTVLFVSHNMAAIENLCKRTIWLNEGKIMKDGPTHQIVTEYLSMFLSDNASVDLENFRDRIGTGEVRLVKLEFLNTDNQLCSTVRMGESLTIRYTICSNGYRGKVVLGMYLYTENGFMVSDFRTTHTIFNADITTETMCFDLVINPVLLYPQGYIITPWITDSAITRDIDYANYAAKFTVEHSDFLGSGARFDALRGIVYIPSSWKKVESNN